MKYCLANIFPEPIKSYQWDLVCAINKNFPSITKTKQQTIPAHFTLKYEFETDTISEVEKILEKFAQEHKATPISLGGLDAFSDKVIFIKVKLSEAAQQTFERLIEKLQKISWMQWQEHDNKNFHPHTTIAQECAGNDKRILESLKDQVQNFDAAFDNITIFQKVGETENKISLWKPIHRFQLSN